MLFHNKKILIICYSFPPHPGIGGRRWAKFSKFLLKNGYDLNIVNAVNYSNETSLWDKDIDYSRLKITSFDFQFQRILKHATNFSDKIIRKILLFFVEKTKYNPHIITSFPNKTSWNEIRNIIVNQKITKVIVSGDPYLFYNTCLLKKNLVFDLILDYRDLWNDHSFYSKIIKLTKKQKAYFEFVENYALNNCNQVIFVDEYIESVVKKRIQNTSILTHVLPNSFDSDDLITENKVKKKSDTISIFFAGSVSSDLNSYLLDFVLSFQKLSENNPEVYNQFSLSIYGELDEVLVNSINKLNLNRVSILNKKLSNVAYYQQLQNADVGIVILSQEYCNSFITKFADYLFYNVYVVSLGCKGYFSDYIEKHNIGVLFEPTNNTNFYADLILRLKHKQQLSIDEKNRFDLGLVTQKLITKVLETKS